MNPYTRILDENGWRLAGKASAANLGGGGPYSQGTNRRDLFSSMRATILRLGELAYVSGYSAGQNPYRYVLNDLAVIGCDNCDCFDALQRSFESHLNA